RGRHPRFSRDWSSDVCSSDLRAVARELGGTRERGQRALVLAREQPSLRQELPAFRLRLDGPSLEPVLEQSCCLVRNLARKQELRSEERRVGKKCAHSTRCMPQ